MSTSDVIESLRKNREEQRQAKGGWYKIMIVLAVALLVLFMAIQNGLNIDVFGALNSSKTSSNTGAGSAIIILVIVVFLYAIYTLLKKCDFSFGCFLLGGEAGEYEQPIENVRIEKSIKYDDPRMNRYREMKQEQKSANEKYPPEQNGERSGDLMN
tara:strand:+ start:1059 stop:1526 length:468 start_codon:yes stop_codon:yes gene_type:complete